MKQGSTIAILGAGIAGCSTALFLARRGFQIHLFDAASAPFAGASRWNEGKIHLGHLYVGDPSLETARSVLPGGLAFRPLVEDLIACSLAPAITPHDDTYLVHRDSIASVGSTARYLEAVTRLAVSQPQAQSYLADIRLAQLSRLSRAELERDYDTAKILAGFRVPERSVSTLWVADRYIEALDATPQIVQHLDTRITAVHGTCPYQVMANGGQHGPYAAVVNALWEGRLAIDQPLGIHPVAAWSHRFRQSVFLTTHSRFTIPSAVVATGPFGDIKNYDGHSFYLSWYPAGLLAEGTNLVPPSLPELDQAGRGRVISQTLSHLSCLIPSVAELASDATEIQLGGGWVYAVGKGSLADPNATLHRRDRSGIWQKGNYFSVDTGKYSTAPWLAKNLADSVSQAF
jgi:glycine/D-amino acid oxidase-like deaminating enzyme